MFFSFELGTVDEVIFSNGVVEVKSFFNGISKVKSKEVLWIVQTLFFFCLYVLSTSGKTEPTIFKKLLLMTTF